MSLHKGMELFLEHSSGKGDLDAICEFLTKNEVSSHEIRDLKTLASFDHNEMVYRVAKHMREIGAKVNNSQPAAS